MRGQRASELIAELETAQIRAVSNAEGCTGGTFVARERVYAYAMWISGRFHLQVIRAYDAMVTGALAPATLTVPHILAAQRQAQQLTSCESPKTLGTSWPASWRASKWA